MLDRMHNPGGTFEDHEVLKLELNQEGHTFADDLAALLDAETWRADNFASAVEGIKSRQQQRLDEARIRREKMPVVKKIQAKFKIPTTELAAAAAIEMNLLTEAERDVLLEVPSKTTKTLTAKASDSPQEIHFTYSLLSAEAHAIYRPADGSWTVKSGSTALNRVLGGNGTNAKGIEGRRQGQMKAGLLAEKNAELLEYVQDVVYKSPSMAAIDISGASRNGWDCWKDAQGRPAQHYRPQ
ncbi:DUF4357 domain-containing protein [Deinococcus radiopugnans]|uniref:Type IV restriction endonuclease n=1 Tax=Deinococcus radiopugnans ATCC 19172 TaxID=585398 RepID=A0ABR6NXT4_9DEIO|nr:DUF4357 domain-containing protein [Deinococcus radiopugnans]MBB6018859.1 putative type IV restriction endonuclease [Deinococcus radiopugnans ATCC 19172]